MAQFVNDEKKYHVYYRSLKNKNLMKQEFYVSNFKNNLDLYKRIVCQGNGTLEDYKYNLNNPSSMKIGKYFINLLKYRKIFEELYYKNPDNYLICPGYNQDFQLEIQVGLSGTKKINENYIDTLKREILEELGISFKQNDLVLKDLHMKHRYYTIELNDNFQIYDLNNSYKFHTGKDIYNNKVIGFISGSLDQTLKLLKATKLPYRFVEKENISHICAIPLEVALSIINIYGSKEYYCSKNKKYHSRCRLNKIKY